MRTYPQQVEQQQSKVAPASGAFAWVFKAFFAVMMSLFLSQAALALESISDEEMSDVVGKGIKASYFASDYQGCTLTHIGGRGPDGELSINGGPVPPTCNTGYNGTAQSLINQYRSNGLLWESYRVDWESIWKLVASVQHMRLGGWQNGGNYHDANTNSNNCQGAEASCSAENWDIDFTNIRAGHVNCQGVWPGVPSYGSLARGFCEADNRPYDPFVLKDPYFEVMFAPECELFGDTCAGGTSDDSVFAGFRVGAGLADGSIGMQINRVSGYMQAFLTNNYYLKTQASLFEGLVHDMMGNVLAPQLLYGAQVWGRRRTDLTSLNPSLGDGILGMLDGLIRDLLDETMPSVGVLMSNLHLQESSGLWLSVVRDDLQWPGQGTAGQVSTLNVPGIGSYALPTGYYDTARDRDYAGWNFHVSTGAQGHGGAQLDASLVISINITMVL